MIKILIFSISINLFATVCLADDLCVPGNFGISFKKISDSKGDATAGFIADFQNISDQVDKFMSVNCKNPGTDYWQRVNQDCKSRCEATRYTTWSGANLLVSPGATCRNTCDVFTMVSSNNFDIYKAGFEKGKDLCGVIRPTYPARGAVH